MEHRTLHAPDISCGHCVGTIQRTVGGLEGVSHVEADATTKKVQVSYDPQRVSLDKIKDTMAAEGYPAVA
jgi:copper chaperone